MAIDSSFVIVLVALMVSYGRWLYLIEKLWALVETEDILLYEKLGKPKAQSLHEGESVVKFLFSKERKRLKSQNLIYFCKHMRRYLLFHAFFSLFCIVALLYMLFN